MTNDISPIWKLSDHLTVNEAAALIAGFDPNYIVYGGDNKVWIEDFETGMSAISRGVNEVMAAKKSLINAIGGRILKATIIFSAEPRYQAGIDVFFEHSNEIPIILNDDNKNDYLVTPIPDWSKTIINVDELKAWMKPKIKPTFFFDNDIQSMAGQAKRKHTSELLDILEHAIADNWDEHAPLNPPTNDSIDQWFTDNYKDTKVLSKVMRDSMRTIMRPLKYK